VISFLTPNERAVAADSAVAASERFFGSFTYVA